MEEGSAKTVMSSELTARLEASLSLGTVGCVGGLTFVLRMRGSLVY